MTCEYEQWSLDEVGQWPGASVTFEKRSKHRAAILSYQGKTRFVVYPDSPGDSRRGVHNHVAEVRQALTQLGASRTKTVRKAEARRRQRNEGAALRQIKVGERAPVRPDPWEALKGFQPLPPAEVEQIMSDHPESIAPPEPGRFVWRCIAAGIAAAFVLIFAIVPVIRLILGV